MDFNLQLSVSYINTNGFNDCGVIQIRIELPYARSTRARLAAIMPGLITALMVPRVGAVDLSHIFNCYHHGNEVDQWHAWRWGHWEEFNEGRGSEVFDLHKWELEEVELLHGTFVEAVYVQDHMCEVPTYDLVNNINYFPAYTYDLERISLLRKPIEAVIAVNHSGLVVEPSINYSFPRHLMLDPNMGPVPLHRVPSPPEAPYQHCVNASIDITMLGPVDASMEFNVEPQFLNRDPGLAIVGDSWRVIPVRVFYGRHAMSEGDRQVELMEVSANGATLGSYPALPPWTPIDEWDDPPVHTPMAKVVARRMSARWADVAPALDIPEARQGGQESYPGSGTAVWQIRQTPKRIDLGVMDGEGFENGWMDPNFADGQLEPWTPIDVRVLW